MKLSKMKYIGIAIIGVVLAVGIYGWQQYRTTEITQEIIMSMCPFMPEQIVRVEVYNEGLTTFVKQDEWVNEEEKAISYDQQIMDNLISQVSDLSTTRIIKNVQDLEVYGINDQSVQITVYNDLNESQSYKIGERIPQENSHYVWHIDKEVLGIVPDIYLASALVPANQMIDKTMIWDELQGSKAWSINQEEEVVVEWIKEGDIWRLTEPFENHYTLNQAVWNQYFDALQHVTKESYVGTNDKDVYGLNDPTYRLEREGKPYITFGSEVNGQYYMTYKEEPYVYTVNSELVEPLLEIEAFDWMNHSIIEQQQSISKVEIVSQSNSIILENKDLEQGLPILSKLTYHSVIANAAIEENNPREAELTIHLSSENGEKNIIEFIPYDPSFYLIREDGKVEFSVEKKPVIEVMKEIEKLSVNQNKDETNLEGQEINTEEVEQQGASSNNDEVPSEQQAN